jgi:hypothetical protein
MTCDPTIASCLTTAAQGSTISSIFATVPPVNACMANPSRPDAFSMSPAASRNVPVSAGLTPLFAPRPLACDGAPELPPMNVDLNLSDYQNRLPAELITAIDPILRLQTEFNVPISFRIVNIQLSTGETVPQIYFFRTGDTPSAPSVRGGAGPTGPGPAPGSSIRPPTSLGLTVSLAGTALAVVAFDRLLLKSLVDNHLMPAEARMPVMFASAMTAHLILNRAGLVSTTPMQGLRAMPTLFGFQILANVLLERLGMSPDSPVTAASSMALSLMPFYLARQSPMLAQALSAVNAGESLTLAGLSEMTAGAATLRLGAAFARILGWIGVIDLGARTGLWVVGRINAAASSGDYTQNVRLWTLVRMTQDIYNQERYGWALAGALGSFISAGDTIDSWFSSSYDAAYSRNLDRIQNQLVAGSDDLGSALHQAIIQIIARNTRTAPDGTGTVDWDAVTRDVREFYQKDENASNIRRGYELVNDATAPMTSSGIASLIDIVNDRGEILNQTEFREHFTRHVRIRRIDTEMALERRSLELGLMEDVGGVRISRVPTDPTQRDAFIAAMTPAQREFANGEGMRLTTEAVMLTLLENSLPH